MQPYMIANLDYAATTSRDISESRRDLEPYLHADLILDVVKTKEFENIAVGGWEAAHALRRNYKSLLDRVVNIHELMAED
jgi:hypothetical protein